MGREGSNPHLSSKLNPGSHVVQAVAVRVLKQLFGSKYSYTFISNVVL
jgi:hypothetical protein